MKNYFLLLLLFLALLVSVMACDVPPPVKPVNNPPAGMGGRPNPTPTPICSMIPVNLPVGIYGLTDAGVNVIHNLAEWNNFINNTSGYIAYMTPTPTATIGVAPVDFNSQMLVIGAVIQPCNTQTLIINNVCESPNLVTISVTSSTCLSCIECALAPENSLVTSAVAAPLSNQPVSIVCTYNNY